MAGNRKVSLPSGFCQESVRVLRALRCADQSIAAISMEHGANSTLRRFHQSECVLKARAKQHSKKAKLSDLGAERVVDTVLTHAMLKL